MIKSVSAAAAVAAFALSPAAVAKNLPDGSKKQPLRVMMVPAETGSSDVVNDYKPVFNAITKHYGIHFKLRSGDSYAAVVQGLCNNQADIGWYGAVTYGQAYKLCGAELLAVDVRKGSSVYYAAIYARKDGKLKTLTDLKGRSFAVGDPNSTSSFNFPFAMVINAGIEPAKDLGKIVIAGSHTNSIAALKAGRVDAAAASFNVWEKSVKKGIIDPSKFTVLAKSQGIPNPPLAMSKDLKPELKAKLREAFNKVHTLVPKGRLLGYGGKPVDRYDANYKQADMLASLDRLSKLTKDRKRAIITKAGER